MTVQVQTKPRPTPITHILFGMSVICTLFGQRSFTKLGDGRFRRSYLSVVVAVLHLSLYFGCLHYKGRMNEYDFPSQIVIVLKKAMFVGNILVMFYATFSCHLRYRREVEAVESVEAIDEALFEMKASEELREKNEFVRRAILGLITLIYVVFYLLSTISLYLIFRDVEEHLVWKTYETMAPIMIVGTMKAKFYVCALVLTTRTEIVNRYLTKRIDGCSSRVKELEKLQSDIETALKVHKRIVDSARDTNNVYGFMILSTFVITFVFLLSDGYIILYCLTVGKENNTFHIFCSTRLLAFYVLMLVVTMRTTALLCAEVNETKNVLFKVKIEPENAVARDAIMVSVFKLMHDKLELKACGMFDMDLSFVFSMFASVTTYLLILLQFDLDSLQRNAPDRFGNLTASLTSETE